MDEMRLPKWDGLHYNEHHSCGPKGSRIFTYTNMLDSAPLPIWGCIVFFPKNTWHFEQLHVAETTRTYGQTYRWKGALHHGTIMAFSRPLLRRYDLHATKPPAVPKKQDATSRKFQVVFPILGGRDYVLLISWDIAVHLHQVDPENL